MFFLLPFVMKVGIAAEVALVRYAVRVYQNRGRPREEDVEAARVAAQQARDNLQAENTRLQNTVRDLQGQVDRVPQMVQEAVNAQMAHLNNIDRAAENLNQEGERLNQTANEMKQEETRQADVVRELAETRVRLEKVLEDKQKLQNLQRDYDESMRLNGVFAGEMEKLQQQLTAANKEIETLRARIAVLEQR